MNSAVPIPHIHILAALPALFFVEGCGADACIGTDAEGRDRKSQPADSPVRQILECCQQYDGHQLLPLADGILMYFKSAEQALACASQIQRGQFERAALLPDGTTDLPCIGIYIGDLQLDLSVLEQRANDPEPSIAAQLAWDAPPGGLAVARAVYDAVNCQLTLRRIHLDRPTLVDTNQDSARFETAMRMLSAPSAVVSVFEASPSSMLAPPLLEQSSREPASIEPVQSGTLQRGILERTTPSTKDLDLSLAEIFSPSLVQPPAVEPTDEARPFPAQLDGDVRPNALQQLRSEQPQADSSDRAFAPPKTGLLSKRCKDQLLTALLEKIGPIATVTISHAEATATSHWELLELLLNTLPKQERAGFRTVALEVMTQDAAQSPFSTSPWELL